MNISEYARKNRISRTPIMEVRHSKYWNKAIYERVSGRKVELTPAGIKYLDNVLSSRKQKKTIESKQQLNGEVQFLQEQLRQKDVLIDKLTTLLDQEQKLNNNNKQLLEQKEPSNKRGFWARVFNLG
ncbi:hypothetical protein R5R61_00025 [Oenococcus oeni]|uniref:hypothetical protein n=2 Tax=Oenococcus oeni TaxID=1247 RepID=UPI00117DAB25|nr:hypothetical protein [Oenococcus oeni]